MAEIGDTVRYLNAVGGGRISKIEGKIAYVDEPDGFTTPVLLKECVVVAKASDALMVQTTQVASQPAVSPKPSPASYPEPAPEIPTEEVPGATN